MVVTWGQNQVRVFGGAGSTTAAPGTPTPSAAPAPSTGFSFGGSTTPAPAPSGGLFGSTTPTPAPGGLFGSTPASAPAPSTGLFGSITPAPAPSTGLFGGTTPAPAPSTGLFGSITPAPAPGLFGTPAPAPSTGLFGAPAPQQAPAGPQIPAHAAMQAHADAMARQEAAKLQTALEKYHKAYTGAPTADKDAKFVTIVYSDISPQQKQLQLLSRGQRVIPPQPPSVSEQEWLEAVVCNPDPELYMPVALVGAMELQTRVAWQQDRANHYAKHLQGIQDARQTLQQRCDRIETDLSSLARIHSNLRSRLLEIMKKVELARGMNFPLQQDEVMLKQRLSQLLKQVDQVNKLLVTVQAKAKGQEQSQMQPMAVVNVPDERELSRVLTGHRETLTNMTKVMEKDQRDLALLRHHVVPTVPLPPH